MELSEWKADRKADAWIAENVTKLLYVHMAINGLRYQVSEHGHDFEVPHYTTHVAADYSVLRKVRGMWDFDQTRAFENALYAIWEGRVSSTSVSWPYPTLYRPGDYAHAAWMALTEGR